MKQPIVCGHTGTELSIPSIGTMGYSAMFWFRDMLPDELCEHRATLERLYAALASLPDKQAKRIYAYYFLGLSKAAIARSEGVSRNQISRSINKALQRMKKSLKNSI
jgi:RNA polymerase sigma-70 factor (ECF subfamily)